MAVLEVYLERFSNGTFSDYFEIYLEENGKESFFDVETRKDIARSAIDPARSIVRGIRQVGTGEILGYCEVQNVDDPEWEIGIYILERYRFRGVGKRAVPLFLDELSSMGRSRFRMRIFADNNASRALFEGAGAKLVRVENAGSFPGQQDLRRGLADLKENSDPAILEKLQRIEEAIFGEKRNVCIYEVEWI